jgi:hypothetical protein
MKLLSHRIGSLEPLWNGHNIELIHRRAPQQTIVVDKMMRSRQGCKGQSNDRIDNID